MPQFLIQYVMRLQNVESEAVELAKKSDLMIIIGGKHSSNTAKLYDVCKPHCVTYLIETARSFR
ncbi:MAG: hypothetical protein V8Q17_03215 [Acutalibacteraceae bacterium]